MPMGKHDAARTAEILMRVRRGEADAADELLPHVYGELRDLARSLVRRERRGHTLDATALLHEAYLRLAAGDLPDLQDRRHFVAIVARSMRQVLVDHARAHGAQKRGGDRLRVTLHDAAIAASGDAIDVLAISPKTVEADWYAARAWLRREMADGSPA